MPTKKGWELADRLGLSGRSNAEKCSAICRLASRAHSLAEAACNGSPYRQMIRYGMPAEEMRRLDTLAQADEDRYTRMDERNGARIIKAVADLGEGFSCSLQGDPRGAVVRIHTPDGRDEGHGGVAV